MNKPNQYYFKTDNFIPNDIVEKVYKSVFRKRVNFLGFAVIDFGKDFSSVSLRREMVALKKKLSLLTLKEFNKKLNYQWLGRFNQQETTKFHRDNAAEQSFLMLGYEPTEIDSKLYLADYSKYARDKNLNRMDYYETINPVYHNQSEIFADYVTEVTPFKKNNYKIVLVNNSELFTGETQGVLHKAEIVKKNKEEDRVINSNMLFLADPDAKDMNKATQEEFINTTKVSH